jgi:SAM-dependent methyltransferase
VRGFAAVTDDATPPRGAVFGAVSVSENYQRHLAPVVFEPWAEALITSVGVSNGDRVLDVASGTGVVARLASRYAGPGGRVVASDTSAAMLAQSAARPAPPGGAPIEFLEASVQSLPLPDDAFDVALCQQGLQFFPDRPAAIRELRRVLRPGGVAGLAVWAAGHRLEPFDDYAEAAVAIGIPPPFPGAFDNATFVMGDDELRTLLQDAGFAPIEVSTAELGVVWPDAASAVAGILGTPFGSLVEALPADRRRRLDAELRRRFESPGAVRRTTTAVIARAVAPGS